MDERLKFVTQLMEGETIAGACRAFGISRKTGHKIWKRYQEQGPAGLLDRMRSPRRHGRKTHPTIERLLLKLKEEKSGWGAPKLQELFRRRYPNFPVPATSTVHAILDRHGLVKRRRRRQGYQAMGTALRPTREANDLWCADFKGQFLLGNRSYCYPLTITDQVSRYLLACEALERIETDASFQVFERVFQEHGMPLAMRTDNGTPFSTRALFGLSKLSVWWLRLGIGLERIEPGHPEQNGRHERMHLTLKEAATKPAQANFLQQQERFDAFVEEFNRERPHEALGMKTPAEVYIKSKRPYPQALPEPEYPGHDRALYVSRCGSLLVGIRKRVFLSEALGGQAVGLREVDDQIWQVSFMDYDLGYFDMEKCRFAPGANPFSLPEG